MAVKERSIIHIDEEKCNGCGLCVGACHEGAIQMVNGKAKLVSEAYCDGLGDCLGPCPTGALSIVKRQAEEFDAEAVAERMKAAGKIPPADAAKPATAALAETLKGGCPGMRAVTLKPDRGQNLPATMCPGSMARSLKSTVPPRPTFDKPRRDEPYVKSELVNWPVQLRLVPPAAPYLKGADILLAADCAPVAVPNFHSRYLEGKPVVIACPKLDDNGQQVDKLAEILMTARPASLTVVRMEVPCCGGLVRVAQEAVWKSGLDIPLRTVVVGADGLEKSNSVVNIQKS